MTHKELIEAIVRAITGPDAEVEVNEVAGATSVIYEIGVQKQHLGKIIGKKGVTLEAIRTIIKSCQHGKMLVGVQPVEK